MGLRNKLLMSFVFLSVLTLVVGMIFYIQLKNLIEPLTPQSLPQSIDKLEDAIDRNNFLFHFLYKQQIVEFNLEDYVLTGKLSSLQDFYMNRELLYKLADEKGAISNEQTNKLADQLNVIDSQWNDIIHNMQLKKFNDAKAILSSEAYTTNTQNLKADLQDYTQQADMSDRETAVVTVKEVTKNTTKVLQKSLHTTILIFISALGLSILFAILASRAISRPINRLRDNFEKLDIETHTSPIDEKVLTLRNEIGDLARSYKKLIDKLRITTVSRDELLLEIDRRKQIEEDLRETADRLIESNNDLDQFAYGVSHDLREPLRGIETLSEWIVEDCQDILPEKSRHHLQLMRNRVCRLEKLISGVLEYSRVGHNVEHKELTDINALLTEVIDSLSPSTDVIVTIDNNNLSLNTYKPALTQVFLNLISNALKFRDKDKQTQIHIGYEIRDDFIEFYVKDNGPGIDEQFFERIFVLFQTLQPRDMIESAGIGLALVKKIVERQGGKVWVRSTLGEGSTFYFTWPKD